MLAAMARDNDRSHLHPAFLSCLAKLEAMLQTEGIPLQLFEGARSPFRQAELFAQGRTAGTPGRTVTKALPWMSFHQYGVAADMVFLSPAGAWSWDEPRPGLWDRYTELAAAAGLRTLSFERPHVEMPLSIGDLRNGVYPTGGDESWRAWLDDQIELWGSRTGGVPPLAIERPPLQA